MKQGIIADKQTGAENLVSLFLNADKNGKALIFDMLTCAVRFGDSFLCEMAVAADRHDTAGMKNILAKWKGDEKNDGYEID